MADLIEGLERVVKETFRLPPDSRGRIRYFKMPEDITWVGTLSSRPGDIRGNHYHPDQEQKLLVMAGRCISLSQVVGDLEAPVQELLVEANQMIITPPGVGHAVIALEHTIFANLVRGRRDLETYPEHTLPHPMVGPEEAQGYALRRGVEL